MDLGQSRGSQVAARSPARLCCGGDRHVSKEIMWFLTWSAVLKATQLSLFHYAVPHAPPSSSWMFPLATKHWNICPSPTDHSVRLEHTHHVQWTIAIARGYCVDESPGGVSIVVLLSSCTRCDLLCNIIFSFDDGGETGRTTSDAHDVCQENVGEWLK